jgi:hypothetical protein
MTSQEGSFTRLRLSGGRFDDGMPVEALSELLAYQELIAGVAAEIFRQANPERLRLPSRFNDRFHLRVQAIEDGSVIPVLTREVRPGTLMNPDDEFIKARDIIEDAVSAMAAGKNCRRAFRSGLSCILIASARPSEKTRLSNCGEVTLRVGQSTRGRFARDLFFSGNALTFIKMRFRISAGCLRWMLST